MDRAASGTFVVVKVGPSADGGVLSNASAQVAIEARDLAAGAVLQTWALPTVDGPSGPAFALSGSATSDGMLNRGTNGDLTLAGYNAAPGIAQIIAAPAARQIARARPDGGIDTRTTVTDAYAGNNVRSAATVDGTAYWLGGSAANDAGVRYVMHGATGATVDVFSAVQNIRATHVFGGQLYPSTAAGTQPDGGLTFSRIFAVGSDVERHDHLSAGSEHQPRELVRPARPERCRRRPGHPLRRRHRRRGGHPQIHLQRDAMVGRRAAESRHSRNRRLCTRGCEGIRDDRGGAVLGGQRHDLPLR